ncbi:hypothetical protein AB4874_07585 [Thioclava sp. 15-R06ZXC-3]|uniref:Uncharacterized protein n=1 Tax=Thioclava arctica TaxID=3238301 RepID=A0ABV3TIW9_9RHOB
MAGQTARWRVCRASFTAVTALFGVMFCRHVVRGEDPGPDGVAPLSLVATKRVGATTVTPRMEKMSPMSDDITFAPSELSILKHALDVGGKRMKKRGGATRLCAIQSWRPSPRSMAIRCVSPLITPRSRSGSRIP